MPTFFTRNIKTEEVGSVFMKWTEFEDYLKANPDLIQTPTSPAIISGIEGHYRPDEAFKDLLGEIKRQNPGSKVNDWR